jgi:alcohol dehydrogenase
MVFDEPGRGLRRMEFDWPHPAAGDAVVEVLGCTLCGSDIHSYEGRRSTPVPTILGHEILGRIVDLGDAAPVTVDGQRLSVGDRVVWGIAASCGDCYYCAHGLPQKCEGLFKYGHEALGPGRNLSGGLATHCLLVRGTPIVRVPPGLPDRVVCPAGCATATVAGALRIAGEVGGRSCLVVGLGMLGLTACAMLAEAGVSGVLATDLSPSRCELAGRFGAEETFEPEADEVLERTGGRGVDVAFDFTGVPEAVAMTVDSLDLGGSAVWIGSTYPAPALELPAEQVVRRCLTIRGLHNYHPEDLLAAVGLLDSARGRYPFGELVGEGFALQDAEAAFDAAAGGQALRVPVGDI